jgi:hypothetical protein
LGKSVTVTAKVPKELKEYLSRHGVNLSAFIRESMEDKKRRLEAEKLGRSLDDASRILQKISDEEIVEIIRWSRDHR